MKKVLLALVLATPLTASATAGLDYQSRFPVHVYGKTEGLARWNIEEACREQFAFSTTAGQAQSFGVLIEPVSGEEELYSATAICVFRAIQY